MTTYDIIRVHTLGTLHTKAGHAKPNGARCPLLKSKTSMTVTGPMR